MYPGVICSAVHAATRCALAITSLLPEFNLENITFEGEKKCGALHLQLSFPRLIDGKPLISNVREKVEFRLVVNQRVFETSFFINASDVLDGSERTLYLPSAFTDSKEMARQ
jgi:hypothetical protein